MFYHPPKAKPAKAAETEGKKDRNNRNKTPPRKPKAKAQIDATTKAELKNTSMPSLNTSKVQQRKHDVAFKYSPQTTIWPVFQDLPRYLYDIVSLGA